MPPSVVPPGVNPLTLVVAALQQFSTLINAILGFLTPGGNASASGLPPVSTPGITLPSSTPVGTSFGFSTSTTITVSVTTVTSSLPSVSNYGLPAVSTSGPPSPPSLGLPSFSNFTLPTLSATALSAVSALPTSGTQLAADEIIEALIQALKDAGVH